MFKEFKKVVILKMKLNSELFPSIVSERAGHFKDLAKSYDFKSVDG